MDGSVMAQVWWLWALLALVVGGVLGYLLASVRARRHAEELQQLQIAHSRALQETAAAQASAEQLQLRVDTLEAAQVQDHNVMRALAPLNQQITSVGRQVSQLERDRSEQFGAVAQALQTARSTDQELLRATGSLESSLRSTTVRGAWGEIQLRRVVEAAGMLRHVDFTEQTTRRTDSGVQRPDLIVHLPGSQSLVVDAKAPMSSYLDAQAVPVDGSEESQERRTRLLTAHAKALRSHVNALGTKKYWSGEENSPDLVLCFVPVESALAAALETDASLLEYAAQQNVALVSPVSLLASLKAVAFSWRQATLTDNARELHRLSRELYERMGTVGRHLTEMGGSLRRSVEGYNKLVGSLETRVLPSARKIGELDPTDTAEVVPTATPVDVTPRILTAAELLESQDEATAPQDRPHST